MIGKYHRKRGRPPEEAQLPFRTPLVGLRPCDYLLDEFIVSVSNEVEEICETFAQKGMFDEFSDGSFLDNFIGQKYEIIRNELQKQQLRHLQTIESIEMVLRTEIARKQTLCREIRGVMQAHGCLETVIYDRQKKEEKAYEK